MSDGSENANPPRPPNPWILFRSDVMRSLSPGHLQSDVSRVASEKWKMASPELRAHYESLSEIKKAEHRALYPTYRFRPMKRVDREKLRVKKRAEKAAERAAHRGSPFPASRPERRSASTGHSSKSLRASRRSEQGAPSFLRLPAFAGHSSKSLPSPHTTSPSPPTPSPSLLYPHSYKMPFTSSVPPPFIVPQRGIFLPSSPGWQPPQPHVEGQCNGSTLSPFPNLKGFSHPDFLTDASTSNRVGWSRADLPSSSSHSHHIPGPLPPSHRYSYQTYLEPLVDPLHAIPTATSEPPALDMPNFDMVGLFARPESEIQVALAPNEPFTSSGGASEAVSQLDWFDEYSIQEQDGGSDKTGLVLGPDWLAPYSFEYGRPSETHPLQEQSNYNDGQFLYPERCASPKRSRFEDDSEGRPCVQ